MLSRREKSLSKSTSIVPKSNTALFKFVSIVLFFVPGLDEIGGGGLLHVLKGMRERSHLSARCTIDYNFTVRFTCIMHG